MSRVHVVVDGSNIATEGRTAPSLAQLDEAVTAFAQQYGYEKVTVIVDATFGHRIDPSEVELFEEAILAGELVTPPAGTIGRGDAFILQVARLADADVLSNDSFQELHAEHPWLFEAGRLWGGKPVPAVGWVFVGRAPVRGVTSRRAVQAAKRASKSAGKATTRAKQATEAAAVAVEAAGEAVAAEVATTSPSAAGTDGGRRRRRRGGTGASAGGVAAGSGSDRGAANGGGRAREPINEQLPYASFVVEHPIGSTVNGTVERFSSHGAYVRIGPAVGYVPLRALGDPPPRSAREVLTIGEERDFVVTRFEPTTRGIDVVPADIDAPPTSTPDAAKAPDEEAAAAPASAVSSEPDAEEAPVSPAAKKTAAKKATAKRATAKKATAKKATAKKAAPAVKKTAAKKSTAKKSTAKKSTAKKATAKRSTAKKSTARKSTAKKSTAKKATAKKSTAKKSAAKKSTAKKATARKSAAKRA